MAARWLENVQPAGERAVVRRHHICSFEPKYKYTEPSKYGAGMMKEQGNESWSTETNSPWFFVSLLFEDPFLRSKFSLSEDFRSYPEVKQKLLDENIIIIFLSFWGVFS